MQIKILVVDDCTAVSDRLNAPSKRRLVSTVY